LCKNVTNSYECAQKIEKYQLRHYGDLVKRDNNKLILKIDNGNDIVLENITGEFDGDMLYSFQEFFENINTYLIHIQYYEGIEFYIINKSSGEMTKVPGLIKISPDNTRLISFSIDLEAGYSPNGFVIYLIDNNSYLKDFEYYTNDWGPSNVEWITDKKIDIEKTEWKGSGLSVTGNVICEFDSNWKLIN
jgi:hypothetical protein